MSNFLLFMFASSKQGMYYVAVINVLMWGIFVLLVDVDNGCNGSAEEAGRRSLSITARTAVRRETA